jgi:hypothetical protein
MFDLAYLELSFEILQAVSEMTKPGQEPSETEKSLQDLYFPHPLPQNYAMAGLEGMRCESQRLQPIRSLPKPANITRTPSADAPNSGCARRTKTW